MWRRFGCRIATCAWAVLLSSAAHAQHLDLAWNPVSLTRPAHTPLAEEYIWTSDDAAVLRADHAKFNYHTVSKKIEPHFFRSSFEVKKLPASATLYLAGPRTAKVWINGILALDATIDSQTKLPSQVFSAPVQQNLRPGRNTIAIEAVRGRGIVAASDSPVIEQIAFGESLVAKIVPAEAGINAPALIRTSAQWRSSTVVTNGWQSESFDDVNWKPAQTLGPIESRAEFFQWNLDAGLYNWPGYLGLSSALRIYSLAPTAITHPQQGVPADSGDNAHTLVDFGREINGRLLIESDNPAHLSACYGESEYEALSCEHYLGRFTLLLNPHTTARGPKSGFRYVLLEHSDSVASAKIRAEGIAYPVEYKGSFRSSDEMLNRIWETGAYTAHLCMQEGVVDGAKRDHGWWAGDLDVAGPVIASVFGDSKLLGETFTHLLPPAGAYVNGIPGYSGLWISALADLYRRTADRSLIANKHDAILALLAHMDQEFDAKNHFLNRNKRWLFVDWSHDLFASTPEASEGTAFEFVRGYRDAAWLLAQIGDTEASTRYEARARSLATALHTQFSSDGVYGARWQLNAMAVLAGIAEPRDYTAIWQASLGTASADARQTISPFFNAYVLQAMARMDRRTEALQWMRTYWGGMLDEGATSFWEAYDLHWPKKEPHRYLEADGRVGAFVSLAHAWSSGPTAWMMDELLGVHADEPGYRHATIRPDLAGLSWIEGAVPTPHGLIRVAVRSVPKSKIEITLPAGVTANLLAPLPRANAKLLVNGRPAIFTSTENGTRASIALRGPARYIITTH